MKSNELSYALIVKALLEAPQSCYDLQEITGLHIVNLQGIMRTFRRQGVVHIHAWDPNSRGVDSTQIYKLGKGKDKARRKQSRTEISRNYRERKRQATLLGLTVGRPIGRLGGGQQGDGLAQ